MSVPTRPAPRPAPHRAPALGAIRTVVIERVEPELDAGRYPVKRIVGERFEVTADIFREGHDILAASLLYRHESEAAWRETPMAFWDNDRWRGAFTPDRIGRWRYTIRAWPDLFRTWRSDLQKKHEAGEPIGSDLLDGARLLRLTADRARGWDGRGLNEFARRIEDAASPEAGVALALDPRLEALMDRHPDPALATTYDRELEVVVDRPEARFAAWYELFPRSQGRVEGRSATFADVEARLPEIQALGFSVLYFPPIHPIGRTNRKGKNNSLTAGPEEPGSPYAIGSEAGGHTAVHPELGTLADFDRLVAAARAHGLEIALDFAIQVSPDHPWVREHPEWFYHRPDGTIKYAENPPKKYQDIYPLNFYGPHREELFRTLRDVIFFWAEHGVRTFRVDNPHTKPVDFWGWLIREVQARYPDVIFLSEAFTRPKMMRVLAKVGFTQSYTYFTWRNTRAELEEYLTELTQSEMREYFRGNLFTNTPDILPVFLQEGGRPAFKIRFVLAATLSSVYGIYSGFELCENRSRPGTEYYLDSEMYEYKVWDWDRPGNIKPLIARVNQIRRENPALQLYDNLRFYGSTDPNIICYGKLTPERDNAILVVVNLDPHRPHWSHVDAPIEELGLAPDADYEVEDLLTGARYTWHGRTNYVWLDPHAEPAPAHIMRLPARPRPIEVLSRDESAARQLDEQAATAGPDQEVLAPPALGDVVVEPADEVPNGATAPTATAPEPAIGPAPTGANGPAPDVATPPHVATPPPAGRPEPWAAPPSDQAGVSLSAPGVEPEPGPTEPELEAQSEVAAPEPGEAALEVGATGPDVDAHGSQVVPSDGTDAEGDTIAGEPAADAEVRERLEVRQPATEADAAVCASTGPEPGPAEAAPTDGREPTEAVPRATDGREPTEAWREAAGEEPAEAEPTGDQPLHAAPVEFLDAPPSRDDLTRDEP